MALAGYSAVYTAFATAGLVLLRKSLSGAEIPGVLGDPRFLLGASFYAASFATFLLALRRYEILTVYPIFSGLAYATVSAAAVIFLGESLSAGRVGGIVFVALGVALLSR